MLVTIRPPDGEHTAFAADRAQQLFRLGAAWRRFRDLYREDFLAASRLECILLRTGILVGSGNAGVTYFHANFCTKVLRQPGD